MRRPLVGLLAAAALVLAACTGSPSAPSARRSTTPRPAQSPTPSTYRGRRGGGVPCARQAPEIAASPGVAPGPLAPDHPSSAVACAYTGLGAKALARTLIGTVGVPDAESFARILNQARPIDEGAVYHCPNDDGSMDVVVFSQADGSTTTVEVHHTGCRFAVSTTSHRAYVLTPAAHRELDHMTDGIRAAAGLGQQSTD